MQFSPYYTVTGYFFLLSIFCNLVLFWKTTKKLFYMTFILLDVE